MTEPHRGAWFWRAGCWGSLVVMTAIPGVVFVWAAIALVGTLVLDAEPWLALLAVLLAVDVVLCARPRVSVEGSEVIVVNRFRRHAVRVADIKAIDAEPFGWFAGPKAFALLVLVVDDGSGRRRIAVEATCGGRRQDRASAVQLLTTRASPTSAVRSYLADGTLPRSWPRSR